MAAGPMSKSKIISQIAEDAEVSKKTAAKMLDSLSSMAHREAKKGFTVPGLGKLVLVNRKARMGRNPMTGAAIKIPAKKVLKFRVAKAAKDAILGLVKKK
jgi:DNA-binding protein HU-beta